MASVRRVGGLRSTMRSSALTMGAMAVLSRPCSGGGSTWLLRDDRQFQTRRPRGVMPDALRGGDVVSRGGHVRGAAVVRVRVKLRKARAGDVHPERVPRRYANGGGARGRGVSLPRGWGGRVAGIGGGVVVGREHPAGGEGMRGGDRRGRRPFVEGPP